MMYESDTQVRSIRSKIKARDFTAPGKMSCRKISRNWRRDMSRRSPNNKSSKRSHQRGFGSGRRGWMASMSRCVYFYGHTHSRVSPHLSSRCKYRSTVRHSSDARYRSCRRSSRPAPGLCTLLRNPTPCLPWVSGGFELLLGRQQSRRPGVVLRGRPGGRGDGGGKSIRGLRFSPRTAGVEGVLTIVCDFSSLMRDF